MLCNSLVAGLHERSAFVAEQLFDFPLRQPLFSCIATSSINDLEHILPCMRSATLIVTNGHHHYRRVPLFGYNNWLLLSRFDELAKLVLGFYGSDRLHK